VLVLQRKVNLEDEQKTGFLLLGIIQIVTIILMLIIRLGNMTVTPKISIVTIIDPIIGNIIICIGAFYGYFLIASDNLNKVLGSIIISALSAIIGISSSYIALIVGIALFSNSIKYRKYLDIEARMADEMEICVKCSNCGKNNPTNVNYCMECGSILPGKEGNVKAQSKKKTIAISIISVIICLLSIAYTCWYAIMASIINMEDISNDNCISFSVLPILIISIFVLIFFMLKSPNAFVILPILAICCSIIALIVPLVIWIFNEALVFLCSCGGLASIAGYGEVSTLKPFIFVIWK
jgi:hypothetical protein